MLITFTCGLLMRTDLHSRPSHWTVAQFSQPRSKSCLKRFLLISLLLTEENKVVDDNLDRTC